VLLFFYIYYIAVLIIDFILSSILPGIGIYIAGIIGLIFAADAYAGFIGDFKYKLIFTIL